MGLQFGASGLWSLFENFGPGVWDAQSRSMVEAAWLQGLLLKFAGGFMLRSSRSVGRVVHIILASLKLDQCLQ